MTREQLTEIVRAAIADQWDRDMVARVERSPEGHQAMLTEAVTAALAPVICRG